jgi:hypothetical protein
MFGRIEPITSSSRRTAERAQLRVARIREQAPAALLELYVSLQAVPLIEISVP